LVDSNSTFSKLNVCIIGLSLKQDQLIT